jgi:hypothetical protein
MLVTAWEPLPLTGEPCWAKGQVPNLTPLYATLGIIERTGYRGMRQGTMAAGVHRGVQFMTRSREWEASPLYKANCSHEEHGTHVLQDIEVHTIMRVLHQVELLYIIMPTVVKPGLS